MNYSVRYFFSTPEKLVEYSPSELNEVLKGERALPNPGQNKCIEVHVLNKNIRDFIGTIFEAGEDAKMPAETLSNQEKMLDQAASGDINQLKFIASYAKNRLSFDVSRDEQQTILAAISND